MFCGNCGEKANDNDKFCFKCGAPLEQVNKLTAQIAECATRYIAGNEVAFNELYELTKKEVKYCICKVHNVTLNEDDVFEIMQQTYLDVSQKIHTVQNVNNARAWIRRVASNKAIDYFKKNVKLKDSLLWEEDEEVLYNFEDSSECYMPEQIVDNKETQRLVRELLATLPEDQQTILFTYYSYDCRIKDIAADLGISENTVKTKLARGRKALEEKVLELEKKQGIRLHSTAFTPALFALFEEETTGMVVSDAFGEAILSKVFLDASIDEVISSTVTASSAVGGSSTVATGSGVSGGVGSVVSSTAGSVGIVKTIMIIAAVLTTIGVLGYTKVIRPKLEEQAIVQEDEEEDWEEVTSEDTEVTTEEVVETDEEDIFAQYVKVNLLPENGVAPTGVIENSLESSNQSYEEPFPDWLELKGIHGIDIDDYDADGQKEMYVARTINTERENENPYNHYTNLNDYLLEMYEVENGEVVCKDTLHIMDGKEFFANPIVEQEGYDPFNDVTKNYLTKDATWDAKLSVWKIKNVEKVQLMLYTWNGAWCFANIAFDQNEYSLITYNGQKWQYEKACIAYYGCSAASDHVYGITYENNVPSTEVLRSTVEEDYSEEETSRVIKEWWSKEDILLDIARDEFDFDIECSSLQNASVVKMYDMSIWFKYSGQYPYSADFTCEIEDGTNLNGFLQSIEK